MDVQDGPGHIFRSNSRANTVGSKLPPYQVNVQQPAKQETYPGGRGVAVTPTLLARLKCSRSDSLYRSTIGLKSTQHLRLKYRDGGDRRYNSTKG